MLTLSKLLPAEQVKNENIEWTCKFYYTTKKAIKLKNLKKVSKQAGEKFAKKTEEFKSKLENVVQRVEVRLKSKNDIMPLKNEDKVIKELKPEIKELIDTSNFKGREVKFIGKENLNKEVVEYLLQTDKKAFIDILDDKSAKKMGFKYDKAKMSISADEIKHTLNRHGQNSKLVQESGAKAVSLEDIANYAKYTNEADLRALGKDRAGQEVLISGKQINGHYIIVENIRKKNNELAFKTMYFQKGKLKDNKIFHRGSNATLGYKPNANSFAPDKDIIPQNPQNLAKSEVKSSYENEFTGQVLKDINEYLAKNEGLNPQNVKIKSVDDFLSFLNGWRDSTKEPLSVKHLQDYKSFKDEIALHINQPDLYKLATKLFYATKGIDPRLEPFNEANLMYQLKETRAKSDKAFIKEYLGKNYDEAKLEKYHQKLNDIRQSIEKALLNIHPIKEFGTNYAEFYHDGKGAIEKLLNEKQGQVAGAFYRKDLKKLSGVGDIDLVWGEVKPDKKGFGLAHILDKHPDFDVNLIPQIVEKGKLEKRVGRENAYNITYENYKLGVNSGFNGKDTQNKWIVTAFDESEKIAKTARTNDFTEEVGNLSKNSKDSIAQKNQNLQDFKHLADNAFDSFSKDFKNIRSRLDFYASLQNSLGDEYLKALDSPDFWVNLYTKFKDIEDLKERKKLTLISNLVLEGLKYRV